MRIGNNPHKDEVLPQSDYLHQVVIPVYIPHQEGYFKDSLRIFQLCIQSLLKTVHSKTCITVVNNGSCEIVIEYLDQIYHEGHIQELIHTENIGKLNAVLKGLAGNNIELVTITDADVLFLENWQESSTKVFRALPKAGVVGVVPQFCMYKNKCGNILFDTLFSEKLKFIPIQFSEGLVRFYDSIGWDRSYNKDYLKYGLGLEHDNVKVFVGSGHFVATYKKQMFQEMKSYFNYKLGGDSENYLDTLPLKYDYWRVTTYDNYAYHMGNVFEDWMSEIEHNKNNRTEIDFGFVVHKQAISFMVLLKNELFPKFLFNHSISKLFYNWKKLPKSMVNNYNNIIPK
ncbi:glycosyltransferase family A protein [Flavobacterium yafengii]|uniref:glycosyltransferase family A protein n=1 Tax=Flavobacterium yafengii TaxID=3041253 RepID=UPI0024A95F7A|nr:glycosyltransferase family A protein [Flavobacterium yafengii]MDI5887387.1 glycosyltransferase family A protein [Flavobacterium yafengii]